MKLRGFTKSSAAELGATTIRAGTLAAGVFMMAGCAEFMEDFIPLPDPTLDAIDKYEKMRKETKQVHSHVQYCENDTLKLTISSRGQLAIREIYVPRKAVALFRNRDSLNTYPLGVLLYKSCILEGPTENCDVDTDKIGVNVTGLDSAERMLRSDIKRRGMEFYAQEDGLYKLRVSEAFRNKPHMKLKKEFQTYINFSPDLREGENRLSALIIRYQWHQYMRPDIRKCSWMIMTDEAVRTSRASHCDDLSDWKIFVSEFDLISDMISKDGEFANDCKG